MKPKPTPPKKIVKKLEQEQIDLFLQDLKMISVKHGIVIGGCGCCGSPHLVNDATMDRGYYTSNGNRQVEWVER